NSNGQMLTGWQQVGGKWYYLNPSSGRMHTGWTWDGEAYYFLASDGHWIEVSTQYYDMFTYAQGYSSSTNYLILVDTSGCRVAVYYGSYNNWSPVREFICSPGKPSTPTVKGQFTVQSKGYVFGRGYSCYYYTQFYGDYLFHSILYYPGTFRVQDGRLGQHLSHGCIRLAIGNAKWIYDTVPRGSKVVVW
ncbi:L,D-transpeptidase, partial [Atopobium fossor]|uniref:L,D-transpeptidase n=1 Tax=Atopobium fossor TaxID=39487 RepID=UPI0012EC3461